MRAMVLQRPGTPLRDTSTPDPEPGASQVLVKVAACGICRTDLHVIDGDLTEAKLPIIPGHEIVGRIEAVGSGVTDFQRGERVGYPGWAIHVANAPIVWEAPKIFAMRPSSPAIRSMAGMQN